MKCSQKYAKKHHLREHWLQVWQPLQVGPHHDKSPLLGFKHGIALEKFKASKMQKFRPML